LQSPVSGVVDRLARLAHQLLAVILSALLLLQPAIANAQTVSASTTAPAANRPGVGAAPNGVPLIDIVTPNAAGLSQSAPRKRSVRRTPTSTLSARSTATAALPSPPTATSMTNLAGSWPLARSA
jgi:hypothetical protein